MPNVQLSAHYMAQSIAAAEFATALSVYAESIGCTVDGDTIRANEEQTGKISAWVKTYQATERKLQDHVDAAMARATENGYDMTALGTPEALAADLCDCDADFNQYADPVTTDHAMVVRACADWLKRQRKP